MAATGDEIGRQGSGKPEVPDFPPGWVDGVPTTSWGQRCAICGTADGVWVHPIDRDLVTYRVHGKGHTLPGYWALCQRCEDLYNEGRDEDILQIMKSAPGWLWDSPSEIDELLRQPLAVFRRADLGARPLAPDEDR